MSIANDIIAESGPHFLLYSDNDVVVCNGKTIQSEIPLNNLCRILNGRVAIGAFDSDKQAVTGLETLMNLQPTSQEQWIGLRFAHYFGVDEAHFLGGSYSQIRVVLRDKWRVIKQCKRYKHPDKDLRLTAEQDFIATLPTRARKLFPRLYNKEQTATDVSYEMEYIPYPTLTELISSGEFDVIELTNMLTHIYDKLFEVLYTTKTNQSKTIAATRYNDVIKQRLTEIHTSLAEDHFLRAFIEAETITVNDTEYPGLSKTLLKAQRYLKDKYIPNTHNHGDLIFQDILVNPYTKDFRLIDGNGDSSGYMYDIAKTLLCLETKYDAIYNHDFTFTYDIGSGANAFFALTPGIHYDTLEGMKIGFWEYLKKNEDHFFRNIDDWPTLLRVLCGVQNIAIVMFHALHHEEYDRACVFLLSGIVFINDTITP